MKNLAKVMSIFMILFLSSCETDKIDQLVIENNVNQELTNYARKTCPQGYHIAWEVSYSGINFRTRKSDCLSDFGLFCLKDKKSGWVCVGDNGEASVPMVEELTQMTYRTTIIGEELINGTHLKLRFPADLQYHSPNGILDFINLDIENDYSLDDNNEITIKQGIYPVANIGNEFVVIVELR